MTQVKEIMDLIKMDQKKLVMVNKVIKISKVAREDLRMIMQVEILNASTVIRPIYHIPLFIHI